MHVALASCRVLPEPDPDEALLCAELERTGCRASVVAWDDPRVRWEAFDACVLRSTWNYHLEPEDFADWVARVAATTPVLNEPELVRWNLHKRYLLELARRGHPVVPTALIEQGRSPGLARLCAEHGWSDVVVKPAISCASFETLRVRPSEVAAGEAHLARVAAVRDVLVQPFLAAVLTSGERALVAIDGELCHAIKKTPRFCADDELVEGPLPIEPDEARVARALLADAAPSALYARVDLVRDASGRPVVLELELIEPSLFLAQHPPALERFARAIGERIERRGVCSLG